MLHGHLWGLGLWSGWRRIDGNRVQLTGGLFGAADGGSSTVYRVEPRSHKRDTCLAKHRYLQRMPWSRGGHVFARIVGEKEKTGLQLRLPTYAIGRSIERSVWQIEISSA